MFDRKAVSGHRVNGIIAAVLIFFPLLAAESISSVKSHGEIFTKTLFQMKDAFKDIYDYRCSLDSFSSGGGRELRVRYRYFYKRPGLIRMEAVNGKYPGSVMVYKMDGRVRVKLATGIFSLLTLSFKPDSRYVTDLTGQGVPGSDWGSFIEKHFENLERMKCVDSAEEVSGENRILVFKLVSDAPEMTKSIAKETLRIDGDSYLLLGFVMYDAAGRTVRAAEYSGIVINGGLSDELFSTPAAREPDNE